jgi:hypothetical protein
VEPSAAADVVDEETRHVAARVLLLTRPAVREDLGTAWVVLERADGWRVELGYPRGGLFALNRRRFDAHYRGAGWNHAWRGSVPRA